MCSDLCTAHGWPLTHCDQCGLPLCWDAADPNALPWLVSAALTLCTRCSPPAPRQAVGHA